MREQWDELKETIIELRDNNGTATQQECCQFLANLMNVLEAQMAREKGKWMLQTYRVNGDDHDEIAFYICSECGCANWTRDNFCPNCGADMREETEDAEDIPMEYFESGGI